MNTDSHMGTAAG